MREKLCPGSSGALGVFSTCEHERSHHAARQRITVSIGETFIFTTVLSLVSCLLTSTRVARRADLSLASHTPCWFLSCLCRSVCYDRAQIDLGCSFASSRTKSSSQIGACEEHACERIRQGLASHSPWFWCSCSRYRSGSTMRSLKATQACKLVCQPLHSDTGQFGRPGLRTSRLRLTSLLHRRVISTSTIMRT